MKIKHLGKFYPPDHGGIETATELLSRAGVGLGHSVDCWVSRRDWKRREDETMAGVRVHRLRTFGRFKSVPLTPGLVAEARAADVVHPHFPHPLVELSWRIHGMPRGQRVIPYLHAIPVSQGRLGRWWFKHITLPLLHRCEKVLVSSPQFADSLGALGLAGRVRVLPFCASHIEHAQLTGLINRRREDRCVLALGRLVPYKGFDLLIGAWADLVSNSVAFKGFQLKIAGEGPEAGRLAVLIKELGVSSSVTLLGQVSEVRKSELLAEACLFVAPSRTSAETFGISILEAMSWGLPVVTTALSTGVAMLAREGECGGLAQPNDQAGLTSELARILVEPRELERAGRANLEFVSDRFSYTRFLEMYREVLKQ